MQPSSCDFRIVEDPVETNRIYRHVFNEDGRCIGSINIDGFFHPCLDTHTSKYKAFYGMLALFCCVILLWLFGYHWGQLLPQYVNKKSVEKVNIERQVDKLPTDIGYILP